MVSSLASIIHKGEVPMNRYTAFPVIPCTTLPEVLDSAYGYRLLPVDPSESYYLGRTDRNIGWITKEEQSILRHAVVGIAGCGGMGGLLASILVRAGVGEVRIADSDAFDVSNINRQFSAKRTTVGTSKARATAQDIRDISNDTTLVVYPQGINEDTVESFLDDCCVVCDEIEFWAVGARVLLHQRARNRDITVFNGNTVGFSTNLFVFEPDGYTMEDCLGLSYDEARILEERIAQGTASSEERQRVQHAVIHGLVPFLPEYSADVNTYSTREAFGDRLAREGRASIIATNPPMATGLIADWILLHLLRDSGVARGIQPLPRMPRYTHFDAAFRLCETRNHQGDSYGR